MPRSHNNSLCTLLPSAAAEAEAACILHAPLSLSQQNSLEKERRKEGWKAGKVAVLHT